MVRRLLPPLALAALLAATATAAAPTLLPKPRFNAPATGAGSNTVHFTVVSSTPIDPAQLVTAPKPVRVTVSGPDGNAQRVVAGPGYALDFRNYAWPPRVRPGEKEFSYEQVIYANHSGSTLYVETAHQTYARSTYGLNAYLQAIDPKRKKLLWRSPALVANAGNFVLFDKTIVSGYGFTAEPDYLYAIDRSTGKVKGRLLLPSAAIRIARHGNELTVITYDHRVVVNVSGA